MAKTKVKVKKQAENKSLAEDDILTNALVPEDEQPYKIPDNWVWVRLGDVSSIISKGTTPTGGSDVYLDSGIGFLRVENILENGKINNKTLTFIKEDTHNGILRRSILVENDVLISIAGTLGRTAIVRKENLPLNTNQAIAFIRLSREHSNENYIEKVLSSPKIKELLLAQTKVTSIPNLTLEIIRNCPIPLPPLLEQKRIVKSIDNLFEKLDRAKDMAQNALDSFETRKAAILHKAFSGELTAIWRKENGVKFENWEEKALGNMTNIKSSRRIFAEEYFDSGIPFFRSSEVVELNDTGYTQSEYFISKERYYEIKNENGVPNKGDLLVTSVGTIGKTWIVDDREFYYKDGNLTLVEQCIKLDMHYLQYYFNSGEFKSTISDTVAGSAYNALTIIKFKNISIPVPSIPEQKEIVRILDCLFEKEKRARELCSVIGKIDLMKKAILARAFRGELGAGERVFREK